MTADDILKEIKQANNIVILTHENPDGDAIGSSIAMHLALRQLGKDADVIIPEYASKYSFLPEMSMIKKESNTGNYDLAIAVDCANTKLLNGFVKYFDDAKVKVVIDHHSSNTMYGDYNYVNSRTPACAQLLLVLFNYYGMEITKDIGECILTGIITDTGGFKNEGVTGETFEFVAGLAEKGINIPKIYRKVFSSMSKAKFDLHRIALNRMEFFENNKITCTYITQEDEKSVGAENGDYDGIVEHGRDIDGVYVSIFLRETDKGIKVSLRSVEPVNVSEICSIFGGGGHRRAAGCTIKSSIEQAKNQILAQVKLAMK